VNATFNVSDLIPFVGGIDDEAYPPYLRTNAFQKGGNEDKPLAKGPSARVMVKRIPEEWDTIVLNRPKLMFMWANEDGEDLD